MSEANRRQVGGEHYKIGGEEHWDRIWRLYGRGYFVGCITKYVERYPYKGQIQDLEKAAHFLQKLIELEKGPVQPGEHYRDANTELKVDIADMKDIVVRESNLGVKMTYGGGRQGGKTAAQDEHAEQPGGGYVNQDRPEPTPAPYQGTSGCQLCDCLGWYPIPLPKSDKCLRCGHPQDRHWGPVR